MSLLNFKFTRLWTKKGTKAEGGFPTYESDEATVRSDMQQLFDELAACLNDQLSGSTIPLATGTTSSIADAISTIEAGAVVENSVNEAAIQDDAVTRDKIKDGEVVDGKLAVDAVSQANMQDDSVGTAEIIDENVTADKMAEASVNLSGATREDGTTKCTVTGILPAANGGTGVDSLVKLWNNIISTLGVLTSATVLPQKAGGTGGSSLLTQMLTAEKNRSSSLVLGSGGVVLKSGVDYGTAAQREAITPTAGRIFFTLIEDSSDTDDDDDMEEVSNSAASN